MDSDKKKLNVLFLCTGNSCRSQMAEGWAHHLKSDCLEAFSAGVAPHGINERAAAIMAEAGVDISNQTSNHLDEYSSLDFDYVITVCDNAKEHCPLYPKQTTMIHHTFDDPSFVIGTDEQITAEFRRVRDEIRDFIAAMPDNLL
ncbi:MAG: arsenate reductase ArsC [Planctomycetota bacterium]|jgi:arsenate reductase